MPVFLTEPFFVSIKRGGENDRERQSGRKIDCYHKVKAEDVTIWRARHQNDVNSINGEKCNNENYGVRPEALEIGYV